MLAKGCYLLHGIAANVICQNRIKISMGFRGARDFGFGFPLEPARIFRSVPNRVVGSWFSWSCRGARVLSTNGGSKCSLVDMAPLSKLGR
jgi:hypothetical protein